MHEKRIARGAAWLDTQEPDWYTKIRVETLDPVSHYNCVIGQVFEYYSTYMCRRYFIPSSWGKKMFFHPGFWMGSAFSSLHGFTLGRETEDQWRRAWAAEIRKRMEAAAPLYVPEDWGPITIRRPLTIIDGQHRMAAAMLLRDSPEE